jgi:outer membrane protein OmpA-like peptidoglycan-associated protein
MSNARFIAQSVLMWLPRPQCGVVLAMVVFSLTTIANAQNSWDAVSLGAVQVGGYARGVANLYWADFPSAARGIGSAACCPEFKQGFGWGWTAGVLANFPIRSDAAWMQTPAVKERFSVGVRVDWSNHSGSLFARTDSALSNGSRASIDHTLSATLLSFGGEALLQYLITPSLQMMFGVRGGAFYRRLYTQTRSFDTASSLRWANGFASDTLARDAVIPNMTALNLDAAVVAGLRWNIPLSSRGEVILSPEILYSHPLSSLVPNRGWAHGRAQAGIALSFAVVPPPPTPPPIAISASAPVIVSSGMPSVPPTPPMTRPANLAVARVAALVRDSTGHTLPAVQIRVEEFVSRRVLPLLVSVFFDEHSAVLPDRYTMFSAQDVSSFSEASLAKKSVLDVYYDMLNIIGYRMEQRPASRLTLTGCLGEVGMNPSSEENDSALSMRRAETVRNYIRDTWGIAENRFVLKSRGLPEQPSQTVDALALQLNSDAEENRRVEIDSDNWEIVKPVAQEDTLRIASYPVVLLRPQSPFQQTASWEVMVRQAKREGVLEGMKVLAGRNGKGNPPAEIAWAVSSDNAPMSGVRVVATFTATDADGQRATATDSIDVQYVSIQQKRNERRGDKEFSTFRLINFDYGKPDPTPRHREVVEEFVMPNVRDESLVRVVGHTDALGNATANVRLSQSRAQAVSQLIGKGKRTVQGRGGRDLLHPNDTPEGRFYSRSVEITVETPIK